MTVRTFFNSLPKITLHGKRVYLRPPQRGDYRHWSKLREESRTFLAKWEPLWDRNALHRSYYKRRMNLIARDWNRDTGYSFHILKYAPELSFDGLLIGGIDLNNIRRGAAQTANISYWLGPPYAKHGFMSEAITCILDFAFDELELHRIEATCLPNNHASQKVLQKSGFQEEGLARKLFKINGAWEDHLMFGLLREEWQRGGQQSSILPTRYAILKN